MAKSCDTPATFIKSGSYRDASAFAVRVLMGHNRWKTVGDINVKNAHPFTFPSVIGAHNGTLRQQHLLPDSHMFDVDSENIYHSFDKIGVKETVPLLNGAYALTWWDRNAGTINMLRNSERPLFFTSSVDGKTIFWASESWMLTSILGRHGVAHQKLLELAPHKHLSIPVNCTLNSFAQPLGEAVVETVTPFLRPAYVRPANQTPPNGKPAANMSASEIKAAGDVALTRGQKRRMWKEAKKARKAEDKKAEGKSEQVGGTTTSPSKPAGNLVGKSITFTVDAITAYPKGVDLKLSGSLTKGGSESVVCWLITGRDDILVSMLDVDGHEFTAKVLSNYPNAGEKGTINIDAKSISLVKEEVKSPVPKPRVRVKPRGRTEDGSQSGAMSDDFFALGFKDIHMTRAEFYIAITKDGCACCGNKVIPKWRVKDIEWMSEEDFLCPACIAANEPEAKDYANQLRAQFAQQDNIKQK